MGGGAVALAGTVAALAIGTTPVSAGHGNGGTGSGNNRGDAWVDAVGAGQVGHENDPHLGCNDIAIWGAMLNDASGPFSIQGWPPSGSRETVWSGTWHYDTASGGSQVIATVPVHSLIASASGMGDSPQAQQGYHFKLDLEEPRSGGSVGDDKYKVFWVDCTAGSGVGPAVSTPTPAPTPAPTAPSSPPASPVSSPAPSGGVGGFVATPAPTPTGEVEGLSTTAPGGGVGGATAAASGSGASTPFTGAALPFELAGGLGGLGLGLLGLGRRLRRR